MPSDCAVGPFLTGLRGSSLHLHAQVSGVAAVCRLQTPQHAGHLQLSFSPFNVYIDLESAISFIELRR